MVPLSEISLIIALAEGARLFMAGCGRGHNVKHGIDVNQKAGKHYLKRLLWIYIMRYFTTCFSVIRAAKKQNRGPNARKIPPLSGSPATRILRRPILRI